MNWKPTSRNKISDHAFLSPSNYSWLRYDEKRLVEAFQNHKKAALGTRLHRLAAELISLSQRLPDTPAAFNAFVNDAIGFRMEPEVFLFYNKYAFGTADAISFRAKILRVHDLKTGVKVTPAATDQLLIYAALFVLEYGIVSSELESIQLRIYNDSTHYVREPSVNEVYGTASLIQKLSKKLEELDKLPTVW